MMVRDSSTSSSSTPPHQQLDDQEESVRIAVRALGDMRNATPSKKSLHSTPELSVSSTSTTSSLPSPVSSSANSEDVNPDFVYRVSHLPLVGSALRAYSQGKASSRVVKYGAEMMESSIQAVAGPVIERLPVNVNTLDEFACRQLDRIERYRRTEPTDAEEHQPIRLHDTREPVARRVPSWLEASSPFVHPPPPPPDSRSSTPQPSVPQSPSSPSSNFSFPSRRPSFSTSEPAPSTETQVVQRSRWQAVLLEAGGLSAALSEESMRRLKYCLQWLQYATAHIDAQILIIRDFMASLQPLGDPNSEPISASHMRTLTDVRRDVVQTIRQVVDVVSKYAGGALPEPARTHVRGFILKLPQRWASAAPPPTSSTISQPSTVEVATGTEGGRKSTRNGRYSHHRERSGPAAAVGRSKPTTPVTSRHSSPVRSSPRMARATLPGTQPVPTAGAAVVAAQRILTLATESLDMMRGVTGVVKDSLDRADAWVGRLRTVGLQSTPSHPESPGPTDITNPPGPFSQQPASRRPVLEEVKTFGVPMEAGAPSPGVSTGFAGIDLNEDGDNPRLGTPGSTIRELPEQEREAEEEEGKIEGKMEVDL